MAEVRRRRPAAQTKPVTRRRDRVDPVDEEEEEDVDVTRKAPTTRRSTSTSRRSTAPVEDEAEEDEDDEEEEPAPKRRSTKSTTRRPARDEVEDEDEDEDDLEDEEDEEPAPRRAPRSKTKAATPRRRAPEPEEEDEEEERAPRRTTRRTTTRKAKSGLPPGVYTGLAGAEEVRKSGGSGVTRLQIGKDPELFKVLEPEPFLSYRQHWIAQGAGQPDRPYTCPGVDCPLCGISDNPSKVTVFNVLHLSAPGGPANKILQVAIRAYTAFKEAATSKTNDKVDFEKNFWVVQKSGTGQKSQTNFRLVKPRDLEEDWPEIFDHFDYEELDDIVAEAKDSLFGPEIVRVSTMKQLKDVAKFASAEDDDDD